MGKKYLDTKQSTIEAAVLDVWVDAAEEQKAIQSAARMVVNDTIRENGGGDDAEAKRKEALRRKREKDYKDAMKKKDAWMGPGNTVPKSDAPVPSMPAVPVGSVQAYQLPDKPTGEPVPGQGAPKPKPDTRRSPGALGGRAPGRSPGALGGRVTGKPSPGPSDVRGGAAKYPKIGAEEPPRKKTEKP